MRRVHSVSYTTRSLTSHITLLLSHCTRRHTCRVRLGKGLGESSSTRMLILRFYGRRRKANSHRARGSINIRTLIEASKHDPYGPLCRKRMGKYKVRPQVEKILKEVFTNYFILNVLSSN